MTPLTRRTFVKGTLACSATAALASTTFAWGKIKPPHANFPTDPRARLSVSTYPFRSVIASSGRRHHDAAKPTAKPLMDLATFARTVPDEFHITGIEPWSEHFSSTEHEDILKLRAAFDSAGVHPVNIACDERVDLCSEDEAKRTSGNATYRKWIDIAVTLGSPSIRIWIPKCTDTSDLSKALSALKPTLDYAATQNVVINLENDDPVLSSDSRIIAFMKLANTPYLRACPDFANSLMGGDEHFNTEAVRHMFAHAWNIAHVKDGESFDGKIKTVSMTELFGIAKASGYRGYYTMESDSNIDPYADTRHLIEQSLSLI
jgi:sugar phosphate isomerase/epimerase